METQKLPFCWAAFPRKDPCSGVPQPREALPFFLGCISSPCGQSLPADFLCAWLDTHTPQNHHLRLPPCGPNFFLSPQVLELCENPYGEWEGNGEIQALLANTRRKGLCSMCISYQGRKKNSRKPMEVQCQDLGFYKGTIQYRTHFTRLLYSHLKSGWKSTYTKSAASLSTH